jgi:hypothetical protein
LPLADSTDGELNAARDEGFIDKATGELFAVGV